MSDSTALEVLLVLDLKDASDSEKSAFTASLKANDWESVPEVAGAWSATFDEMGREEVVDETEGDLDEAAEASGVAAYSVALQFSEHQAWVLEG